MNRFLTAAFYLLVKFFSCHLLAYYPYKDSLRAAPWKALLPVTAIQLLQCALYGLAACRGGSLQLVEYVFALVYMLVYFHAIRADRFRLLFLYLFVMDYSLVQNGLASFLDMRFFYREGMPLYSLHRTFLLGALAAVSLPFLLRFFARARDKVFAIDAPALWRRIWLIPAFSSFIVLLYTGPYDLEQMRSFPYLFSRLLLIGNMFVVYFVLLEALNTIRKQAALEEHSAMQEHLLSIQKLQYGQLVRHMEQARAARHDLRQHLGVLRSFLEDGSMEKLSRYLDAYEDTLPADIRRSFCANYAVNAVLSYYAEEARGSEIDFDARCRFPESLPVSEPEFCALLGNLLENAIDACREALDTAPFIRVAGICEDGRVSLTVDNTCKGEPQRENGRFLSSRHPGYGTGTYSVLTTAERSGGTADFSYQDGVFYVSVLLYGEA